MAAAPEPQAHAEQPSRAAQRFKDVTILVALLGAGFLLGWLRLRPHLATARQFSDGEAALAAGDPALRYAAWEPRGKLLGPLEGGAERAPAISPDGRWLVFQAGEGSGADLCVAPLEAGLDGPKRGPARPLTGFATAAAEIAPAFDGAWLYCASDRAGGLGGFDLYRAPFVEGEIGPVEALPAPLNSSADDCDPSAAGGGALVFASRRVEPSDQQPAGLPRSSAALAQRADFDLYWAEPIEAPGAGETQHSVVRLVALCTPAEEREPRLASGGAALWFASNRQGGQGGFDLYRAPRLKAEFGAAEPVTSLCSSGEERSPLPIGRGFSLLFDQSNAGAAAQLVWAESRELYARPSAPIAWRELLVLSLLLLLALLAWAAKHWRAMDVLYRCYLASLVVHMLFLWWSRGVTANNGTGPVAGGEVRHRVRLVAGPDPGSLERGGRLSLKRQTVEASEAMASSGDQAGNPAAPTRHAIDLPQTPAISAAQAPSEQTLAPLRETLAGALNSALPTAALESASAPGRSPALSQLATLEQRARSTEVRADGAPTPAPAETARSAPAEPAGSQGPARLAPVLVSSVDLAQASQSATSAGSLAQALDAALVPSRRTLLPAAPGESAASVPVAPGPSASRRATANLATGDGESERAPAQRSAATKVAEDGLSLLMAPGPVAANRRDSAEDGGPSRLRGAARSNSGSTSSGRDQDQLASASGGDSGSSDAASAASGHASLTADAAGLLTASGLSGDSALAPRRAPTSEASGQGQGTAEPLLGPEGPSRTQGRRFELDALVASGGDPAAQATSGARPSPAERRSAELPAATPGPAIAAATTSSPRRSEPGTGPRRLGSESKAPVADIGPDLGAVAARTLRVAPEAAEERVWQDTPFQSRSGAAKVAALSQFGGSERTEAAVERGLAYLAGLQQPEGYWGDGQLNHPKYGHVSVGITGLVLLAFLGAGHTAGGDSVYAPVVRRAIDFLLAVQGQRSGHFGNTGPYSHAIATYALAESLALEPDPRLRAPIEAAVAHLLAAQDRRSDRRRQGGWGYFYPSLERGERGDDGWPRTSVSAWCVMALESARLSGIEVEQSALDAARAFFENSFDPRLSAFRYSHDPDRLSSSWPTLPASTPAALFVLGLFGADIQGQQYAAARDFVLSRAPLRHARVSDDAFVRRGQGNPYFIYYGTLATFRLGGDIWKLWNTALQETLLPAQRQDGSWKPICTYALDYAGDTDDSAVYTTALCVLSLEVYYRYFTPLLRLDQGPAPASASRAQNPPKPQPDPEAVY